MVPGPKKVTKKDNHRNTEFPCVDMADMQMSCHFPSVYKMLRAVHKQNQSLQDHHRPDEFPWDYSETSQIHNRIRVYLTWCNSSAMGQPKLGGHGCLHTKQPFWLAHKRSAQSMNAKR